MEANLRVSVPPELCQTVNGKKRTSDALIPFLPNKTNLYLSKPLHPHPPGCSIRDKTCLNCSLQRPWWSIKCNLTDCVHEPGRLHAIPCTPMPSAKAPANAAYSLVHTAVQSSLKKIPLDPNSIMLNMAEMIATQLLEGLSSVAMVNGWVHQA